MFSSLWNFVKRHRRKFIFTGAFVGGVYLLGRYAKKRFIQFQEQEAAECMAHARKQHHFDSNQRTCNVTVLSMLPTLRQAILKELDSEGLTDKLKNRPANKLEIWEELKIMSFTRTIVAVYSSCLLTVKLRVLLNIIGGYIYQDSLAPRNGMVSDGFVATQEVQEKYLSGIEYLLGQGLKDLIKVVNAAVTRFIQSKSLKEEFSLGDVQRTVDAVRTQVEIRRSNGYHDNPAPRLCQFILQENKVTPQGTCLSREEELLQRIQMETKEMLESGDFHTVLSTCLDTGFSRLLDHLAEHFQPNNQQAHCSTKLVNPIDFSMPLAKVIPLMNKMVHVICSDAPNPFVQELLIKEQVQDFAANIYEAFSQPLQNQMSA